MKEKTKKELEKELQELREIGDCLLKIEAGFYIAFIVASFVVFIGSSMEIDRQLEYLRKPKIRPYRSVVYKGDTLNFYSEREYFIFMDEYKQHKR